MGRDGASRPRSERQDDVKEMVAIGWRSSRLRAAPSPSSRGPGQRLFTSRTGVRLPLGTPSYPPLPPEGFHQRSARPSIQIRPRGPSQETVKRSTSTAPNTARAPSTSAASRPRRSPTTRSSAASRSTGREPWTAPIPASWRRTLAQLFAAHSQAIEQLWKVTASLDRRRQTSDGQLQLALFCQQAFGSRRGVGGRSPRRRATPSRRAPPRGASRARLHRARPPGGASLPRTPRGHVSRRTHSPPRRSCPVAPPLGNDARLEERRRRAGASSAGASFGPRVPRSKEATARRWGRCCPSFTDAPRRATKRAAREARERPSRSRSDRRGARQPRGAGGPPGRAHRAPLRDALELDE